jgi:hypothetical protein
MTDKSKPEQTTSETVARELKDADAFLKVIEVLADLNDSAKLRVLGAARVFYVGHDV